MDTRKIVDYAYEDNAKEMRDALYTNIADRVSAHLEAQKQQIAQSLYKQPEEQTEEETSAE
jgi:uncharacterized protein (DUF2267 family)